MRSTTFSLLFSITTMLFSRTLLAQSPTATEAGICRDCVPPHIATDKLIRRIEIEPEVDPRRIKDRLDPRSKVGYNAIGVVELKNGIGGFNNNGTGFVTQNRCIAMTNKHVVKRSYLSKEDLNVIGRDVTFFFGQTPENHSREFQYKLEGQIVEAGNHRTQPPVSPEEFDQFEKDWVMIKLIKPMPRSFGHLQAKVMSVEEVDSDCKSLEIAGFPGQYSYKHLRTQDGCKLVKTAEGEHYSSETGFHINCPVTKGSSGSPIICHRKTGESVVIGLARQNDRNNNFKHSQNVNFVADLSNLDQLLEKHKTSLDGTSCE